MTRKRKLLLLFTAMLIIIFLYAWGFALKVERYHIHSEKIDSGLKLVFISDLHNCFFGGADQSSIIKKIDNENPDIVVFGGDVLDTWGGTKHALTLMKNMVKKYPCFYMPGNHERNRDDYEDFLREVQSLGINIPMGKYSELSVRGQKIRIYGVIEAGYKNQMKDCFSTLDNEYYNILIAHQPEQYSQYLDSGSVKFDLMLSGHAHAGQWRIPGILDQGLYAPDQGLFPKYTNGRFDHGSTVHIVSRGLAKPLRMIFIPRIFNRPELSVIETD